MKKFFPLFLIFMISALAPISARAEEPVVLTWEDCVREAARNNPGLIVSVEQVKSREAAQKAAQSGLLPQVRASAGGSTSRSSGAPRTENYSAQISGSQLIFDGKQTVNNVKSAAEDVEAAKQGYRFASAELRGSLRAAFVNLMKAQDLIGIAREIFNIRRDNLELVTLRYHSGLEHKGALLTAEANLAQARYSVSQAERGLEVARRDLAREMGRAEWTALSAKGEFAVADLPSPDLDLNGIAGKHPQVLQAAAQKNAAQFDLKAARGSFAPTISVEGAAGETGPELLPDRGQANAGVSVTLPIFEGGLRHAQVAQASAGLRQSEANQRDVKDTVLAALERTRAALADAAANVAVQEKSLLASEERSAIAQAQYSIGTITFDSWIIIEDNLVTAKRNYLNAQANALLAEADWVQAKGETLEYEQ